MRLALVHDWLLAMRGGERVLEVICEMFPESDIFTLFHVPERLSPTLQRQRVIASSLNRIPGVSRFYRSLLPFYAAGVRDLSTALAREHARRPYDAVLSVSHCIAKNITPPPSVPHLCYCLTPVRYLFDQYHAYFGDRPLEPVIRRIAKPLRDWDVRRAQDVDRFVGISRFVAGRIERYYGRKASVVYPPVRTDWITPCSKDEPGDGFLCVSALVPYKNVDVIVRAFKGTNRALTIVGSGPEERSLRSIATPNIRFIRKLDDDELARLYRRSEALVFAAEEDFGMVPVEMLAAGRPVICYARGGTLETVSASGKEPTGLFFSELTVEAVRSALVAFDRRKHELTSEACVRQAREFSSARFEHDLRRELLALIEIDDRIRQTG